MIHPFLAVHTNKTIRVLNDSPFSGLPVPFYKIHAKSWLVLLKISSTMIRGNTYQHVPKVLFARIVRENFAAGSYIPSLHVGENLP